MTWSDVSIGEITSVVTKGTTPTTYGMPFVESGINFVKAEALNGDVLLGRNGFNFIDEATHEKLARSQLKESDVLVTIAGANVGQCGLVRLNELPANTNQAVGIVRVHPEHAEPKFVYYYFKLPSTRARCLNIGGQAAQPNVNLANLKAFRIRLPSREVQKRTVAILSCYDDLIGNNKRRIVLLEESARLLFKEWFIYLRYPGHEHNKIVDGVPEGWENRTLGECADFLSGGTPSKARAEFWEGDIPWVSSGELTAMRIHSTSLNVTADAVEAGSRLVPTETILAVVRGMSLANEFRIGLTARPMSFNQDLKAIVARPGIDPMFLYHALDVQRDQIRNRANEASHGTKKLDTPVLSQVRIIVPTIVLQDQFRSHVSLLHRQWDCLEQQNARLQASRDLLLPRLMDGRLSA